MLLNIPQVDYLTLTTFHNADELLAAINEVFRPEFAKEAKIAGYKGYQWPGLFFGSARQRNRPHWLMRASGAESDVVLDRTRHIEARCTRIDVQLTTVIPPGYDARTTYDTLASIDVEWPSRRLTPSIIQSGDFLDTIYIGSRTSDRFCRLYVKPDSKGNPAYLRFEVEFKGVLAIKAREALTGNYATKASILRAELDRLPYTASRALRTFDRILSGKATKIKPERVDGQSKTLDWLETQVEPAVLRLLNSHEDHDRMASILARWIAASHR